MILLSLFQEFVEQVPGTLLIALIGAMVLDWVTGILKSLYLGNANSKSNYKGIIKKLGIIVSVLLGAITDLIVSDGTPLFTVLVIMFAVAGEGLSIIENLSVMGVHIPKPLAERLTQVREHNNRLKDEETTNNENGLDCEEICSDKEELDKGVNQKG